MRATFNPTAGAKGGQAREVLEAVAAYDRVAPVYGGFAAKRQAYLDAVDAEILQRIPAGSASLLDVGAGDGRRGSQIAKRAGISRLVLTEPSLGMCKLIPPGPEVWNARMETLPDSASKFDLVLCLWNVLGHVASRELRVEGLKNLGRNCSANGLIFLDVVNRYNVAECGLGIVLKRILWSRERDVLVRWQTSEGNVETWGHVFTEGEVEELVREAGLKVVERIALHYRTGQRVRRWRGNLLYVLWAGGARLTLP